MSSADVFIINASGTTNQSRIVSNNVGCMYVYEAGCPLPNSWSGCPDYSGRWTPCNDVCPSDIMLSGAMLSIDQTEVISALSGIIMTLSGLNDVECVTLQLADMSTVTGFASANVATGAVSLFLSDGTTPAPSGAVVIKSVTGDDSFICESC